ncbi:hypothetical protein DFP72DRAFT_1084868 [Ephemerocybe angulata]|uniref:Uncharacterized protein n=1 Tax=Ephemerocybe angulata TaxID=980116 RepID=A0A8H6LSY5_9AGAR|nr:hypothetical protein DFP72DRAFT_1084868 [Tulosesus angulatus]
MPLKPATDMKPPKVLYTRHLTTSGRTNKGHTSPPLLKAHPSRRDLTRTPPVSHPPPLRLLHHGMANPSRSPSPMDLTIAGSAPPNNNKRKRENEGKHGKEDRGSDSDSDSDHSETETNTPKPSKAPKDLTKDFRKLKIEKMASTIP